MSVLPTHIATLGKILFIIIAAPVVLEPSVACADQAAPPGAERSYAEYGGGDIAEQLNRQQLALDGRQAAAPSIIAASPAAASPPPTIRAAGGPTDGVGVLLLRSDGGDPAGLRVDDASNFVYVIRRNGEGRVYQYGREVQINPVVKDGARQIGLAQFNKPASAAIPWSRLPASVQEAVRQNAGYVPASRVLFTHIADREDTTRIADMQAAKFLALEEEATAVSQGQMVELVRMVMRLYGLKSNVCDTSNDPRCDRPGVREAFLEIKREELAQGTLTQ